MILRLLKPRRLNCLLFPILLLSVIGCGGPNNESSRLLRQAELLLSQDSLSDSALVILETVKPAELSDFDKSRLTVLTALARYKSYIPLGSDSLLQIAVKRFEGRGDSLEYLSCLLTGVANKKVKRYEQAFMNLHRAEDLAIADSNFYYAGLAQREQGDIYNSFYLGKDGLEKAIAAKENFKKANKSEHEKWQIIDQAGSLISLARHQDAVRILDSVLADSSIYKSDYLKSSCYYKLSFAYEHLNKPEESLKYLALSNRMNPAKSSHLLRLGRIYARCWKLNDAQECLDLARDKNLTRNDSIEFYFLQSELCRMRGDYENAYKNIIQSHNMYTADLERKNAIPFDDFSNEYYKDIAEKNRLLAERQKHVTFLLLSLIMVFAVMSAVSVLYVRKNKRFVEMQKSALKSDLDFFKESLSEAKSQVRDKERELERVSDDVVRLEKESHEYKKDIHDMIISRYQVLDNLCKEWAVATTNPEEAGTPTAAVEAIFEKLRKKEGLAELEDSINKSTDGFISQIRANYPGLSEYMVNLAMLSYLRFSGISIAYILGKNTGGIYTAKNRLKKAIEENEEVGPRISAELFS